MNERASAIFAPMLGIFLRRLRVTLIAIGLGAGTAFAQLLPAYGDSRTATTGAAALKLPTDAAAMAMEGAVTAMLNSPAAAFWNPGALPLLDSVHWAFQGDYLHYLAGLRAGAATLTYSRRYTKYWAFRWANLSSGYMNVTDELHPTGNGDQFAYLAFIPSLSYAMVLTRHFNFGITARLFHESFYTVSNTAFLVDLGFVYDLRLRRLTRIGVTASNFGFMMQPTVGPVTDDDSLRRGDHIIPPAVFRLSVVRELVYQNAHQLLASVQLNHPTDNNETISIGVEYNYRQRFFLRTGYEVGTDERRLPAFGAGFRWPWRFGSIRADYALRSRGALGWTQALTIAAYLD